MKIAIATTERMSRRAVAGLAMVPLVLMMMACALIFLFHPLSSCGQTAPDYHAIIDQIVSAEKAHRAELLHAVLPAYMTSFQGCGTLRFLPVTAVFTAPYEGYEQGTEALATEVDGRIVPTEPYLRNPAIHTKPGEDYVKDWLRLANLQLSNSGACFAFDMGDIKYVIEKQWFLHLQECSDDSPVLKDSNGKEYDNSQNHALFERAYEYFNGKARDLDPNYTDRVIFVFRWGRGDVPAGQGCYQFGGQVRYFDDKTNEFKYKDVGLTVPYVLMSGKYAESRWYDGRIVVNNNQLTHEFGHYMSLLHPQTDLWGYLFDLATKNHRNPNRVPLAGSPIFTSTATSWWGVTKAQIPQIREEARNDILTLNLAFDGDDSIWLDAVPVRDTAIDPGPGLQWIFGHNACEDRAYHFSGNGTTIPFTINAAMRNNVMGYWECDPVAQIFSRDQVTRMQDVLAGARHNIGYDVPWRPGRHFEIPIYVKLLGRTPSDIIPTWDAGTLRKHLLDLVSRGTFVPPAAFSPGDWDYNYGAPARPIDIVPIDR